MRICSNSSFIIIPVPFSLKTAFQLSRVWSVSQFIACPSVCLRVGLWYFTDWWREWIYSNNILIQCHRDQIFNNVMQKILLINQLVITRVPYINNMGKETKRLSTNRISGWRSWVYHYIDFMLEYISQLYIWLPCATKKIPLPFLFYNHTPSPFLSTSFSNSLLSFSLIPLLIKPKLS